MKAIRTLLILSCMLALTASVHADLTLLTERGQVDCPDEDFIDWGVLGPPFTAVPNPFSILSNAGRTVDVSKADPSGFERRNQNTGWSGNFAPGDHLLWTSDFNNNNNPVALMTFGGEGICAGGAQIQADFFGTFVARIEAFDVDGNSLGFFTRVGVSNPNGDNSAIFIGVESDVPIHKLAFSLDSAFANRADFAINQFDFCVCQQVVPEPTSMTLLGVGGLGMLVLRLRRRSK